MREANEGDCIRNLGCRELDRHGQAQLLLAPPRHNMHPSCRSGSLRLSALATGGACWTAWTPSTSRLLAMVPSLLRSSLTAQRLFLVLMNPAITPSTLKLLELSMSITFGGGIDLVDEWCGYLLNWGCSCYLLASRNCSDREEI
jgi:hypothetical protein